MQYLGANNQRVKFYIFVFHHYIKKKSFESNLALHILQIIETIMMHLKVQKYFVNFKAMAVMYLLLASVAHLDAPSDWRPGGRGFNPCRGRQHSFVEIDHEIFSTVILSLPLIQDGQLSVSGERMCTVLVNRLED